MVHLRLGTRGSPLALAQAKLVRAALAAAHGWDPEAIAIVTVRTTGDRVQDRALAKIGGKALWTRELDRALRDGAVDLTVHSMKDVETIRPESIAIAAMLPRADVRDRLIGAETIAGLPVGALIGTSSPRRRAQLLSLRPDLRTTVFRGNVGTRLAKLGKGEVDATLLAAAGLDRLGHPDLGHAIPIDLMLPALSQGAVGVEVRAEDDETRRRVMAIDDAETSRCVMLERAFLAALGGDCQSPVAGLATITGARMHLSAALFSPDGDFQVAGEREGAIGDPDIATGLAASLLAEAPPPIRALFTG
jgi:hydroxymethylbilane synthase